MLQNYRGVQSTERYAPIFSYCFICYLCSKTLVAYTTKLEKSSMDFPPYKIMMKQRRKDSI